MSDVEQHDGYFFDLTAGGPSGLALNYTDEASIRRALAKLAHAYGWAVVREEVVVPGWGRIDLVLQERPRSSAWLVELKIELKRPSAARRAFQQADGYGRWWVREEGTPADSVVVAAELDNSVMKAVGAVYSETAWCGVSAFMEVLRRPSNGAVDARLDRAHRRLAHLERELALYRRAVQNLEEDVASPNGAKSAVDL